jgi:choline monooxygenase
LDESILDALTQVQQPTAQASGMFNAAYHDPAYFEFERDHLMAQTWVAVAFERELPKDGYAKPFDFMGLPLVATRNRDGEISVFHNVCSHRGMVLIREEIEVQSSVRCPYHSWTYDLDGNLKGTPHIGGVGVHSVDGFSCEANGLKRVRSHSWLGIIFVNLSGAAQAFEERISPLEERWTAFTRGIDKLAAPKSGGDMELTVNCNWKLAVENYCESYHLPWVHPSLNTYSPLCEHYNITVADSMSGQGTRVYNLAEIAGTSLPTFPDWPEEQKRNAEYISLYPNVLLGVQVDHVFVIILHPMAHNKTVESLQLFYVGEEATADIYAANRQSVLDAWKVVFAEDIFAVEGMQRGRASPGYKGGVFSPVMDVPTHHFHSWVAERYTRKREALPGDALT